MRDKVQAVLEEVRPALISDGGDVELVDVDENGIVKLRLTGSCVDCPMSMMTLKRHIERIIRGRLPVIVAVEQVP